MKKGVLKLDLKRNEYEIISFENSNSSEIHLGTSKELTYFLKGKFKKRKIYF